MGKGAGIENDAGCAIQPGFMKPIYEVAFMVALVKLKFEIGERSSDAFL